MVRKPSWKIAVVIVSLAVALIAGSYNRIYPFRDVANEGWKGTTGTSLLFGWHTVQDQNSCEVDDSGWPLKYSRGHPDCTATDINNLAGVLDYVIIAAAYLFIAALIVYGVSSGKRIIVR